MITLKRGPAPDYLKSEKLLVTSEALKKHFKELDRIERLRFDMTVLKPIKPDLLRLSNNKCVYCESTLGTIMGGDIENFRPKAGARGLNPKEYAPAHYWWLAYDWDNLVISCAICSEKYKRDFFPLKNEKLRCKIGETGKALEHEGAMLIDPFVDEPFMHLLFEENGNVKAQSPKGKVTIEVLGLNRKELVEHRHMAAFRLKKELEMLVSEGVVRTSKKQKDLYLKVADLETFVPVASYAAVQRIVFGKWYEKNAALWERLKRANKDNSKTVVKKSSDVKQTKSETNAIKKISNVLDTIKRFSIKSIEIENFKSIEQLTLTIKAVDESNNRESWLLLLGDNGIGKSSILQAITLALSSKKQLTKLKLDVTDFLRRGTKSGKVVIHSYEHDEPVILTFDKKGFVSQLKEAPTFILGYGSTRLLPKGNIKPQGVREPYLNIKNLFDYSVALSDPNQWISGLGPLDFKTRVAPAFFDVLALKGEDKLWFKRGKINIKQHGEDHDLEDNSDGYKTITALVADIMQTLSLEKANYHNSQGIVLIDEIGNHLHPRWRMKIAGALRKAFPKLQFIVTTHEPLCLRGLSHGEVTVLVRDQQNIVKALNSELLPDHNQMRIEQLLTSDLFGLINVVDEEVEKTYEEYYKLLSKREEEKTADDKVKITELSIKLSDKEVLGNNTREQVLYKVIDQTIAQKIRDDGFKTQEVLKKETIEEVSTIVKSKNLDWL